MKVWFAIVDEMGRPAHKGVIEEKTSGRMLVEMLSMATSQYGDRGFETRQFLKDQTVEELGGAHAIAEHIKNELQGDNESDWFTGLRAIYYTNDLVSTLDDFVRLLDDEARDVSVMGDDQTLLMVRIG